MPLADLGAQHAAVAGEIAEGWREVLARTAFIGGPQVAAFEREYAGFIGVPHCVAVANGTDAIEIVLRA
ncbi:MAG: DegT/DnrJ/EryC1/StrS aminotransferase family protein, partial [Streptosporangiaceae bacterium]|nr:DegT/DnrJ/EryC1/StrS aminotransferase family protein [Streptosporangiaceae bacterium]